MKTLPYLFVACCFVLFSCTKDELVPFNADSQLNPNSPSFKQDLEDEFIVVFKPGFAAQAGIAKGMSYQHRKDVMGSHIRQHLKKSGLESIVPDNVYSTALCGFSAKINAKMLEKLKADNNVLYIENNKAIAFKLPVKKGKKHTSPSPTPDPTPEPTPEPTQPAPPQQTPWGISRIGGYVNYSGSNCAWIIDTGIDYDHPDLNVDIVRAKTFVRYGDDALDAKDNNGHGTHVAGIVAAINNNIGVVGVAAGAKVVPVKVLDLNACGFYSDVIAGIDYVAANASPGDVANISLGASPSDALDAAVIAAAANGIHFVIAAGNSAISVQNVSPARAVGDYVYTISAMDSNNYFAYFSNYNNPSIKYSAPGVDIISTYKGKSYATMSGTSMAAPHVAGLLLSTGGIIKTNGTVLNDRDSYPDPIAHR